MPTDAPTLRDHFVDVLIERLENDHYPSGTMMDQIQFAMTDEHRDRYVQLLIKRVAADRYPSPDLIRRITALVR
jgi:hypothetical protein